LTPRAFNLEDKSLTQIFTAPKSTELTGIGANRVGDKAYLTFTIQRPAPAASGPLSGTSTVEAPNGVMVSRR